MTYSVAPYVRNYREKGRSKIMQTYFVNIHFCSQSINMYLQNVFALY